MPWGGCGQRSGGVKQRRARPLPPVGMDEPAFEGTGPEAKRAGFPMMLRSGRARGFSAQVAGLRDHKPGLAVRGDRLAPFDAKTVRFAGDDLALVVIDDDEEPWRKGDRAVIVDGDPILTGQNFDGRDRASDGAGCCQCDVSRGGVGAGGGFPSQ